MTSLLLTDPLLLTLVTGVGLVLATTAIVLAQDASARAVAHRAEDIVPQHAASQDRTLIEGSLTEPIHQQALDEFHVTPEPVGSSGAR